MHDLKVSTSTTNVFPPSTLFLQYLEETADTKAVSHVASVSETLKGLIFVSYQLNKLISAVLCRLQEKRVSVQLKYHTLNLIDVLTLFCTQLVRGLYMYDTTDFLNTCKSSFEEKGLD